MLLMFPLQLVFVTGATVWFVSCIDAVTCFTVQTSQCHGRIYKFLSSHREGREAVLEKSSASHMRILEEVDHHVEWFPTDKQRNLGSPQTDRDVQTEESRAYQGMRSLILVPLNYKDDIKKRIDIEVPYYALKNEHSVIDETTGESVGFICTVRREMPISRENGGISFGEVGRHTAASASVATALKNPKRGRFHYLASDYTCIVGQLEGIAKGVLSQTRDSSGHLLTSNLDDDEFIIFCRCNELSKRASHCDIYLETKDTTWHVNIEMSLVSTALFNKKYPPAAPDGESVCPDYNPYTSIDGRCLESKKWYPERALHDWITLEASLPAFSAHECIGHFYDGGLRAVPHSVMLFHNGDLIGEAIARLTDRTIPYKKLHNARGAIFEHRELDGDLFREHIGLNVHRTENFSENYGIKMKNWQCQPQNLNIADSERLHLQVRTYLKDGELGEPGSTYCVECLVKEKESGSVCYKATGTFGLDHVH